jgi:hypothetical protein
VLLNIGIFEQLALGFYPTLGEALTQKPQTVYFDNVYMFYGKSKENALT